MKKINIFLQHLSANTCHVICLPTIVVAAIVICREAVVEDYFGFMLAGLGGYIAVLTYIHWMKLDAFAKHTERMRAWPWK